MAKIDDDHDFDWVQLEGDWLDRLAPNAKEHRFITGDFPRPERDHYVISVKGRLLVTEPDGSFEDLNYHGMLCFYSYDKIGAEVCVLEAKFTDGQMVELYRVDTDANACLLLSEQGIMFDRKDKPPNVRKKIRPRS